MLQKCGHVYLCSPGALLLWWGSLYCLKEEIFFRGMGRGSVAEMTDFGAKRQSCDAETFNSASRHLHQDEGKQKGEESIVGIVAVVERLLRPSL